jgi:hypothetical protein
MTAFEEGHCLFRVVQPARSASFESAGRHLPGARLHPILKPDRVSRANPVRATQIPASHSERSCLTRFSVPLRLEPQDRGEKGTDWTLARSLEDRIGAYQPVAGDFERAEQLLKKYRF